MNYVAGFMFDQRGRVALVEKNRGPEAVVGKLNGIGGKVEVYEDDEHSMAREFEEETGVSTHPRDWQRFLTLMSAPDSSSWWCVSFFRCWVDDDVLDRVATTEDEVIHKLDVDEVPYERCVPNLSWILPLARYTHDSLAVVAREVE